MTARQPAGDGAPRERQVPAPHLRETAEIWWDADRDPVVRWDAAGSRFWLVDVADGGNRLLLASLAAPAADPQVIAHALADGLAACDFPPTGGGVAPDRALRTLRAAGLHVG